MGDGGSGEDILPETTSSSDEVRSWCSDSDESDLLR